MGFEIDWNNIPEKEFEKYIKRLALVERLTGELVDNTIKKQVIEKYCEENNVTKRTIYNYLKRYQAKGSHGLLYYYPKNKSLRIGDSALRQKIIELVIQSPTRSVPQIRRILNKNDNYVEKIAGISDRTIYRFLSENGYSLKERYSMLKEDPRMSFHKFESNYSMELVQGDARDGIWIEKEPGNMIKTYLFLWIDDYSRKILFGRYYDNEKLPCMLDCFKYMILRYGIPLKFYLDNGKVYISRLFAWILAELCIKKIHHKPYMSWCKGKVEAGNKIIKNQFQKEAQLAGMKTLEELNTAFWAWAELEYNKRIHSVTGEVPDERFLKGLKADHKRIEDLKKFNNMFLWRESRTITKYGRIKLFSNQYPVKKVRHGNVVQVRFDPLNLSEVYIYDEANNLIETTKPSKLNKEQMPNIPEESRKTPQKISEESKNYFTKLRKEYLEEQKAQNNIPFSKLYNQEENQ
jgi:putative transposase